MRKNTAMYNMKALPEDERPREKILRKGVGTLSNAELLAALMGTGTKDVSAIGLANRVLSSGKGLAGLTELMPEEFASIHGVGPAKACQIAAALELGRRIAVSPKKRRVSIGSPEDVALLFMEELRYKTKEVFRVMLLNTKNEILMIEDTAIGDLNSSIVHPREVFINAIKKSAASVIVAHNHPSGNPEPSTSDVNVTKRLVQSGEILGIKVLDHLIIGDGVYISLKERNLM